MKFVSHLLRAKLRNQHDTSSNSCTVNRDRYIANNLWYFVKNVIEKGSAVLPSFTRDQCTRFFYKMFSAIMPNKSFSIPNWIPKLSQPSNPFDVSPPSYEKVTSIIRRIKSSGSPCPLDKISIICFKRCP